MINAGIKNNLRSWASLKEKICFYKIAPYFNERDVWWTSIGFNIRDEQNGKNKYFERPVLIVKKFNNNVFIGMPLTTKNKSGKFYFPVNLSGSTRTVILSQVRLLDSKRLIRKLGIIDLGSFSSLKDSFVRLIR